MLEETGVVVAVPAHQKAQVKVIRSSTCGDCASKEICKAFGGTDEMLVLADNPLQAHIGEQVVLSLPQKAFLRASIIVYLIPLILLLGGAVIGQQLSETAAVLGAFLGLGISVLGLWIYNKHIKGETYAPTISRILDN